MNGAPFEIGSLVRTVGAIIGPSTAINGSNFGVTLPDGSSVMKIFAVEGKVSALGEATFSGGSIFFASISTGNLSAFSLSDPSTWNFTNTFAKFDLIGQMDILDGDTVGLSPSAGITEPAAAVNVSSVAGISTLGSGIFVFREDEFFTPGSLGGPFTNPGLGAFTGKDWLRDVEVPVGQLPMWKAWQRLLTKRGNRLQGC